MKKSVGGSKETIIRKDQIAGKQKDEDAKRKLVQNGERASQHEEGNGQTHECVKR